MSFCFNFEVSDKDACYSKNESLSDDFRFNFESCMEENSSELYLYQNINIEEGHFLSSVSTKIILTEISKTNLYYYDETELDTFLKSPQAKMHLHDKVQMALQSDRDVIPGQLEGGFTIWRGSCDLVNYLDKYNSIRDLIPGARVLEAGCGAGLPGLYAMRLGATCVHFQDFNRDVITNWTIPNVLLNSSSESNCLVEFSSGDWLSFAESYTNRFDLILSAETIYRKENYLKLHTLFDKLLNQHGSVILAAKIKYYAVDGDLNDFLNFVDFKSVFSYEVINLQYEGVVRCIIILKKK